MRGPRRRAPVVALSRSAGRTRRHKVESSPPTLHGLLGLQRSHGNRAVQTLLDHSVQRAVGWPEAKGWNAGGPRTIDARHRMLRVALAGLTAGNKAESPNPTKTAEKAADATGARAIVWIHPDLDPAKPVQVVAHLHGLTNREADPFAGWRENIADPKTSESDAAKKTALETAEKAVKGDKKAKRPTLADMPNPLGDKVRDVERDRIGEQIEALGDPQVMAVLPQGTGVSRTQMFGAGFTPDDLVKDVLTRLATEPDVTKAVKRYTTAPTRYTIVLSAHSAGGSAMASALSGKRTRNVGGLILFDALWGEQNEKDPTTWDSSQRQAVLGFVRAGCKTLGTVLRGSGSKQDKDDAIAALPGVRGAWTGGVYSHTYKGLEEAMHQIVDDTIPAAYRPVVKTKFRIVQAKTTHDRMIGEVGATGTTVGALQEALGQRGTFVAPPVQRQQAPPPPPPPPPQAPPPTPAQLVAQAAERVRDAARIAAAPFVGTAQGAEIVRVLTDQLIRREGDPRPAMRRNDPNDPLLPLYDGLYDAAVVADLGVIDQRSRDDDAANVTRREVLQAVIGGLVTDVQPRTAVAAPAQPLDHGIQVAGERAVVPRVLPHVGGGRTWDDVRLGVITEFGGLVDGTRVALARANTYYGALQPARFRNVTRNTSVHPDLNAAFARADAVITQRLAATPEPRRTELTTAIATVLGRDTWSTVLRENRNSPHRLSDHSFGFAIDIDSPRNPNMGRRGALRPVQDVTGGDPTPGDTAGRTGASIETTATNLRTTSDAYQAAMANDASLTPVLLRLANDARARATPALPALTNGAPILAGAVIANETGQTQALRTALWPEAPAPPPRVAGQRPPRPPAPPAPIADAMRRIALIGKAFRQSFTDAGRTRRAAASSEGTLGSVAAHGFLTLPPLLVGALAGSDGGNLRWLGTANQDFMHFELMTRPALFTAGEVADPAPPDAAHGAAAAS